MDLVARFVADLGMAGVENRGGGDGGLVLRLMW